MSENFYKNCLFFYNPVNNSAMKTMIQEKRETVMRLFFLYAIIRAMIKPARADQIFAVASKMAGKVITDSVT